jgi:hypothetical protein
MNHGGMLIFGLTSGKDKQKDEKENQKSGFI